MRWRVPSSNSLRRRRDSHKGDFGHGFILAGSGCTTGAACLAAAAALRSGVGSVTLGVPRGIYPIVAARATPEVMFLPLPDTREASLSMEALGPALEFALHAQAVLIGPGLSQAAPTQDFVRNFVARVNRPLVIDADGLNALAGHVDLLKERSSSTLLTPHPKEMSRLCATSVEAVQADRINIAKDFALRYNITLILKGFGSVIADSEKRCCVNKTGNPGMATAGSGDVLAGIVLALTAQGWPPFEAARAAAHVHGLAGDYAARDMTETGLIASDIVDYLPRAWQRVEHYPSGAFKILPK
jgi:hydroxyethylthiazole kinase-like uncharacterized protein yjeF